MSEPPNCECASSPSSRPHTVHHHPDSPVSSPSNEHQSHSHSHSHAAPSSAPVRRSPNEHTSLLTIQVQDVASNYHTNYSSLNHGHSHSHAAARGLKTPESVFTPPPVYFKLYLVRWYILILFSIMALFNNMLAYTFASVHRISHRYFHGKADDVEGPFGFGMSTLVSCYFISYIIFSFPGSWFIERYGFKLAVLLGAWLQAIGCLIRVVATPNIAPGSSFTLETPDEIDASLPISEVDGAHGQLGLLLIGQLVISLGQAFFINPAPLLAATWFGVNERTLATTIAVNANTLGIAIAYLLGPAVVTHVDDLPRYVQLCFGLTLTTAIICTIYFPARPATPPSHSQTIDEEIISPSPDSDESDESTTTTFDPAAASTASSSSSSSNGQYLPVPPTLLEDGRASSYSNSEECDSSAEENDEPAVQSISERPAVSIINDQPVRPLRPKRSKSEAEIILEQSFNSMPQPPCDFVVKEIIQEERVRSKNSQRLLASWHVFRRMFQSTGFIHTLIVFSTAEGIINGLSAFMNQIVEPWGYTSMKFVGYMVCAFIGMCMVGSAVIGYIVDHNKSFKLWIIISLLGSGFSLLYLIHIGPVAVWHIWVAILSLGFFIGPIQPLSIETAVEVTYPAPESSVTAVQQVLGNIFSAALFPLIIYCRDPMTGSMTYGLYLMFGCLIATSLFYITFHGKYRRLNHEKSKERAHRDLHRRIHEREKLLREQDRLNLIKKMNEQVKGVTVADLPET